MAASFLPLCVLLVFTIKIEAQIANVTLQNSSNSTDVGVNVNVTTEERSTLPEAVPEVVVKPQEVTTSSVQITQTPVPQVPIEDPQIAAKQMKGSPELFKTLQLVEPNAIKITKVLGSRCSGPKDCLPINNTSCIDGVCDCISGFIPSKHSLDKCIKVPAGLDDECEEEAQCAHVVTDSECRGGRCSCPPNYVFDLKRCWERQLLGGLCNTSLQCDNIAFSMCAQGVCTCQEPLIPSPNNKCLQPAEQVYRAVCEEDIQCTKSYGDEAHCSNSQCICTNNYHFNGTICLPDKKLGDGCIIDEDCAVSDINNVEGSRACIKQNCACAIGFSSLPGEEICTKSSGEELAVSLTWILCIVIAKYYLS